MTTLIRKDLNDLSIVSLMDVERAIALSDNLIDEDPSIVLQAQEELLAVIGKRNKKIDGIEWARQEAQRDLEWITSQEEECKKTKKRLKSKLESLKNLLKFLANYSGSNEIKGSVWHWTLADVKKRKVEVNTDTMETWDDETKEKLENRGRITSRGLMESLPQADSVAVHPSSIDKAESAPIKRRILSFSLG